jgi:hypothetical protein
MSEYFQQLIGFLPIDLSSIETSEEIRSSGDKSPSSEQRRIPVLNPALFRIEEIRL